MPADEQSSGPVPLGMFERFFGDDDVADALIQFLEFWKATFFTA